MSNSGGRQIRFVAHPWNSTATLHHLTNTSEAMTGAILCLTAPQWEHHLLDLLRVPAHGPWFGCAGPSSPQWTREAGSYQTVQSAGRQWIPLSPTGFPS